MQGGYGQGPSKEVAVEKVEEEVTKWVESKSQLVSDDETFTTKPVPSQEQLAHKPQNSCIINALSEKTHFSKGIG